MKRIVKKQEGNEYRCYSIKQREFLNKNGQKIKREVRHPKTNKIAYIYEKTPQLDALLTRWTKGRDDKKWDNREE